MAVFCELVTLIFGTSKCVLTCSCICGYDNVCLYFAVTSIRFFELRGMRHRRVKGEVRVSFLQCSNGCVDLCRYCRPSLFGCFHGNIGDVLTLTCYPLSP